MAAAVCKRDEQLLTPPTPSFALDVVHVRRGPSTSATAAGVRSCHCGAPASRPPTLTSLRGAETGQHASETIATVHQSLR